MNPLAGDFNHQPRVSLTISGAPRMKSMDSDIHLFDDMITQMQVLGDKGQSESDLLAETEKTFKQLKDQDPDDVYAQYMMLAADAFTAEDDEFTHHYYEHCKLAAKTFWLHNSPTIIERQKRRPSTELLVDPDGKVYVQGQLRDKPKKKAQIVVPVEDSVSKSEHSHNLARQGYYDVVDNQYAFAPIGGGHGYYPQYGHGSSYQPQMIGGYEQYDMLMVPLAMLLFCLICIACFLCNAFIGFGCYFAGKTLVDGHKTEVEKEYDFSAV